MPQSTSFCVKEGKKKYFYQTDNYGGRLLNNKISDKVIQIFGDSQVLGLGINKIEQHYLNNLYKNYNFVLYAAPNNGPYEVINFLNKNKEILQKKIIVTFNFSTDIYRVSDFWKPQNYVALKDYDLNEILQSPFKYRFIIFKNFLLNKNFTTSRNDNNKMQKLFINSNKIEFKHNLIKYFEILNKTANRLDIEIDFIITHPYWIYSFDKKNRKLELNKDLSMEVEKLICKSFSLNKTINRILISNVPEKLNLDDLTLDKRHLRSTKIKLTDFNKFCKN